MPFGTLLYAEHTSQSTCREVLARRLQLQVWCGCLPPEPIAVFRFIQCTRGTMAGWMLMSENMTAPCMTINPARSLPTDALHATS